MNYEYKEAPLIMISDVIDDDKQAAIEIAKEHANEIYSIRFGSDIKHCESFLFALKYSNKKEENLRKNLTYELISKFEKLLKKYSDVISRDDLVEALNNMRFLDKMYFVMDNKSGLVDELNNTDSEGVSNALICSHIDHHLEVYHFNTELKIPNFMIENLKKFFGEERWTSLVEYLVHRSNCSTALKKKLSKQIDEVFYKTNMLL